MKNRCILLLFILLPLITYSQLFVEAGYSSSLDFGYQKDDTQPQIVDNGDGTVNINRVPTSLGKDYAFRQYKFGVGYRWKKNQREHSLSLNYNRKGAGGEFAVDIFLDEYASELRGDILIAHIQFGGYTVDSTDYMFGIYYDNIGFRYDRKLVDFYKMRLKSFFQFDYSYNERDRIISISNVPDPVTSQGSHRDTKVSDSTIGCLINLGLELEKGINKQIAVYASMQQSLNSYTKRGDIFSNSTFITTFELGLRFYQ